MRCAPFCFCHPALDPQRALETVKAGQRNPCVCMVSPPSEVVLTSYTCVGWGWETPVTVAYTFTERKKLGYINPERMYLKNGNAVDIYSASSGLARTYPSRLVVVIINVWL